MPFLALAATLLLALVAPSARAQAIEPPRLAQDCDYRRCAYNIVPRMSGLMVTRGGADEPVGLLGFLWTRDLSPAFYPEAQAAARAAVRTRRVAAVLTDIGLLSLTGSFVALAQGNQSEEQRIALGAGAGLLLVSVPIQFRADGHLARAVWLHNERFSSRPSR